MPVGCIFKGKSKNLNLHINIALGSDNTFMSLMGDAYCSGSNIN